MGVRFGWWSTVLLMGSVHGLVVAGLLWRSPVNRPANRALAGLLLGVVLMITPYTIGYAGIYDAWPWLTFTPFFWQLSFGPLMWLYVRQLARETLPVRWAWHFLPAIVQGSYYLFLFLHPLAWKWDWSERVHVPYVLPAQTALTGASLAMYWWLACREYGRWQAWMSANSAAHEACRLTWLRQFLGLTGLVILVGAGFAIYDVTVRRLSYFDEFPLYIAFTVLVYVLGIEGWRHAGDVMPRVTAPLAELPVPPTQDWKELGSRWSARIADECWYGEPNLSLADVARRVGTNTAYLSRAFNEGLGLGFSAVINRMRVEAACRALEAGAGALEVAMTVGFGSKATFNRVFRQVTGVTPTAWRAAHAQRLTSEKSSDTGASETPQAPGSEKIGAPVQPGS